MSRRISGTAKPLSECIFPLAEVPTGPNSGAATFAGLSILDVEVDVPSCVRVSFNQALWFRESTDAGIPQWQVSVYVLEALDAGPLITVRSLRARGCAINVSPGRVMVGVSLCWVGAGAAPLPGTPGYPTGLVQATISDLRAQWAVVSAGNQQLGASLSLGPLVFDPDAIYENGTFYGRRFAEALRVHWRSTALPLAGPIASWQFQYLTGSGVAPVFGAGIWPIEPTGQTDLTIDTGVVITKSFAEVSLSFEWVIYG